VALWKTPTLDEGGQLGFHVLPGAGILDDQAVQLATLMIQGVGFGHEYTDGWHVTSPFLLCRLNEKADPSDGWIG